MRQNTFEPGAARAIFSTSASQSTANRRMPSAKARAMSFSFLIVVAVADAIGRRAGGHRLLDFDDRSSVETRAEPDQQIEDRRIGIGLDGVEYARVRQRLGEPVIILAHDVEIDDQARSVLAMVRQEIHDAIRHSGIPRRMDFSTLGKVKGSMAIRLPDARWRRVPSALTRHRDRSPFRAGGWRAATREASDQMLRRGDVPAVGKTPSVGFHSHRLEGIIPSARPAR
jgi:hypothetical protein